MELGELEVSILNWNRKSAIFGCGQWSWADGGEILPSEVALEGAYYEAVRRDEIRVRATGIS